jgi:hypothetical protein
MEQYSFGTVGAVVGGWGGIGSSIRDVGVGAPKTQIITVSFSTEDSY